MKLKFNILDITGDVCFIAKVTLGSRALNLLPNMNRSNASHQKHQKHQKHQNRYAYQNKNVWQWNLPSLGFTSIQTEFNWHQVSDASFELTHFLRLKEFMRGKFV